MLVTLEDIPEALREGENWELLTLDPNWVWLAEEEGRVVGVLIASNCHGLVFIWRVKMLPDASYWALGKFFRKFIRDIKERGCLGYLTFLNMHRPEEAALARIAYRAGANFTTATSVVYGSVIAKHVGEK